MSSQTEVDQASAKQPMHAASCLPWTPVRFRVYQAAPQTNPQQVCRHSGEASVFPCPASSALKGTSAKSCQGLIHPNPLLRIELRVAHLRSPLFYTGSVAKISCQKTPRNERLCSKSFTETNLAISPFVGRIYEHRSRLSARYT